MREKRSYPMLNILKDLGISIVFSFGFWVFRFALAVGFTFLPSASSNVAIDYLFWGIQIVVLLLAMYWLWRTKHAIVAILTPIFVLLSLPIGPMD